jgi:hypothetical protein
VTEYLLSLDPGRCPPASQLGTFSDDDPYELVATWQPRNGAVGFLDWWHSDCTVRHVPFLPTRDLIVSEAFTLRNNKFVANVEPVRIEGVMLALGLDVVYQQPAMKSLVGDAVLKRSGLYIENAQAREWFDHPDARDVNDAITHALAYLKRTLHRPSLLAYWPPEAIDE